MPMLGATELDSKIDRRQLVHRPVFRGPSIDTSRSIAVEACNHANLAALILWIDAKTVHDSTKPLGPSVRTDREE